MGVELNALIKAVNIKNLDEDDKEELLRLFIVTRNPLIRNRLALIFSDLQYNKAVRHIIKKINDKSLFNRNGTLIYSLENLEVKKYFLTFIRVICEHEYEARYQAYEVAVKNAGSISKTTRNRALQILDHYWALQEPIEDDKEYNNSILHFIEATKKVLLRGPSGDIANKIGY